MAEPGEVLTDYGFVEAELLSDQVQRRGCCVAAQNRVGCVARKNLRPDKHQHRHEERNEQPSADPPANVCRQRMATKEVRRRRVDAERPDQRDDTSAEARLVVERGDRFVSSNR